MHPFWCKLIYRSNLKFKIQLTIQPYKIVGYFGFPLCDAFIAIYDTASNAVTSYLLAGDDSGNSGEKFITLLPLSNGDILTGGMVSSDGKITVGDFTPTGKGGEDMIIAEFTAGTSVGISPSPELGQNLIIYPNPAQSYLSLNATGLYQIEIIDMMGQTILRLKNQRSTIDVSSLQPGMYLKRAKNGNEIQQAHFVKQ